MRGFAAAHMKGRVPLSTVGRLLAECAGMRGASGNVFHSSEAHNPYLRPQGGAASVRSEKLLIAGDRLPQASVLPELYAELMPEVAAAVGADALYPHGDVMNRYYYNVYRPGHELGWHYDNSAFGVNILLSPAADGGALQYAACASEADVAAVVAAAPSAPLAHEVPLAPGDVVVFRGRDYLHRVSPVRSGERVNVILCYGARPDERLHADTKRQFFGRADAE
eukprot:TRINITY_DN6784_c0_g1_i1.p1 TRINITY_DN6784_c0_g1~~TRINITY_DN6784_c0_g1_i1.p1  ORF type:complete len:223 (+),score=63.08 TRINITY_DN6784_c0_g1_i1:298-966(+)